jgi:hypothetical protein
MSAVTNKQLLKELLKALDDMDYFNIYPSRTELRRYIQEGVSDEFVQREVFPNWQHNKTELTDPVGAYKDLRENPRWPYHEEA